MTTKHRILVMAHAHPDFSLGGGEIAAYNLFKAYREHADVEDAWYLGRADRGRGATGGISLRRENEYLWEQAIHDWHTMKAVHQDSLTTWFADLIRAIKPTVVHTHHYAHLGLEYLRIIKQIDPSIKIVMTLHEFMAICSNNGQMVKPVTNKLCSRATFDECSQCFPNKTREDFWLRKHTFERHFAFVDNFVAPSEFLRQRYIDWGIAPESIVVIENGQPSRGAGVTPLTADRAQRNRFGFFGQINPFKGLDVILRALTSMPTNKRRRIVLEVHGANLEYQTEEFRARIEELRRPLMKEGVVQWVGAYQPHELPARLANVDWVVVPSIWWENSPMVIQEAFVYQRPVICSDIGGMREKVQNGITGLHVAAGNALAWETTLTEAARDSQLWERLMSNICPPLSYAACAERHLDLLKIFEKPLSIGRKKVIVLHK